MRIVIGNLPDKASEESIRQALSQFAPVENIAVAKEEGGTPSAIIEMEMTRGQAEALAQRIQGRVIEGQAVRAWVPLMGWN